MSDTNIIIDDLIPHRDRMKLIDAVAEIDEQHCVCRTTITDRWPLQIGNHVRSVIIVELVAQSAGILLRWRCRHERFCGSIGWLVGVRKATFREQSMPIGVTLGIMNTLLMMRGTYATVLGVVRSGDRIVGEVEVQVFRPE
jgi:Predicted 3-hydroxylacyl-(acyl carrier protein) dehydratase